MKKTSIPLKSALLATAVLCGSAIGASAFTLTAANSNPVPNGLNLTVDRPPETSANTINTRAGTFELTSSAAFSAFDGSPEITSGPSDSFFAWCVDLFTFWDAGEEYSVIDPADAFPDPTPPGELGSTVRGQIQKLLSVAYGNVAAVASETNVHAAAVQLALWEIVFENPTNGFDVDSGDLDVTTSNTSVNDAKAQANTWLGMVTDANVLVVNPFEVTYLFGDGAGGDDNTSQNLITISGGDPSISVIPLPAGVLLMGTALAGFGFAGWRRRRQVM